MPYKAFDINLCYDGVQYKIGETTSVPGKIWGARSGINFCSQLFSCIDYSGREDSRFCEVLPVGDTRTWGNRSACNTITVVKELVGEELSTLLTGQRQEWYKNGQLKMDCTYKDGKRDGLSEEWYENGIPSMKYTSVGGKTEGVFRSWYDNGQLKTESMHKAGRSEGPFGHWFENGKEETIGGYVAGKMDGLWTWSLENGRLLAERTYANGELLTERIYA